MERQPQLNRPGSFKKAKVFPELQRSLERMGRRTVGNPRSSYLLGCSNLLTKGKSLSHGGLLASLLKAEAVIPIVVRAIRLIGNTRG